jgi:lysyl-tRNA synthetase class 2
MVSERGDDWRPGASVDALRARARLLDTLRAYFRERGVLEVETPILSRAAGTDPALSPLTSSVSGRRHYLQTSPEFAMKRLLAAGSGDIFQIARVFRDDETGRYHNPEFTMLEWYRTGMDHHALMDEMAELLSKVLPPARFPVPASRQSFRQVIEERVGLDVSALTAEGLCARLAAAEVPLPPGVETDVEALLDLLLGEVVGPTLGHEGPLMVYDYPASRAALARVRPGDPPLAERFEVYLAGIELANGFHELCDGREQRRRFEAEQAARVIAGMPEVPIDAALLAALDHGLPACAGVALGVDRLLMCVLGLERLSQAMAFDSQHA